MKARAARFNEKEGTGGDGERDEDRGRWGDVMPVVAAGRMGYFITCGCTAHKESPRAHWNMIIQICLACTHACAHTEDPSPAAFFCFIPLSRLLFPHNFHLELERVLAWPPTKQIFAKDEKKKTTASDLTGSSGRSVRQERAEWGTMLAPGAEQLKAEMSLPSKARLQEILGEGH